MIKIEINIMGNTKVEDIILEAFDCENKMIERFVIGEILDIDKNIKPELQALELSKKYIELLSFNHDVEKIILS